MRDYIIFKIIIVITFPVYINLFY